MPRASRTTGRASRAAGIRADDDLLSRVASSEETYLAGGEFDMDRMVGFVRDHLVSAATQGRRVRTAGWMEWLSRGTPGVDRVMEYEARMNLLVPDFDCTFVCIYDLSTLNAETLVDILATHPFVILKGQIRENGFYVPPDAYLKMLTDPSVAPEETVPLGAGAPSMSHHVVTPPAQAP